MTALVSCFRCGKPVLIRPEALREVAYCSSCRNSLGTPDPVEPADPPASPAPKTSLQREKASPKAKAAPAARPSPPARTIRREEFEDEEDDRPRKPRQSDEEPSGGRTGLVVGLLLGGFTLVLATVVIALVLAKKDKKDRGTSTASGPGNNSVPASIPGHDPLRVGPKLQPAGATVPLWRSVRVSATGVWGVSYSPDGATLATTSGYLGTPGELRLWDANTGTSLAPVLRPGSDLFGVAYRPDGGLLAVASGSRGVQVYDRQGRPQTSFRHPSYVRAVAFSPDGSRVASNCERQLTVWDLQTGRSLWSTGLHGDLVAWRIPTRVCFSPDGRTLAAGNGSRSLVLYDAHTGDLRGTCTGHRDVVVCAAYSPDGRYLASGSFDHTIKVWDPASGRELKTLRGHTDWVYDVAFARDGQTLASAGREGGVILWNVVSGQVLATLAAHTKEAGSVAFSPRGKILASSGIDGMVHLWDVSRVVRR